MYLKIRATSYCSRPLAILSVVLATALLTYDSSALVVRTPPAPVTSIAEAVRPPPAPGTTIAEVASEAGLTLLLEALKAVGGELLAAVNTEGTAVTVLAPTNEAFAAALRSLNITKEALFADKATLANILQFHIIPGVYLSRDIPSMGVTVPTLLSGQTVELYKRYDWNSWKDSWNDSWQDFVYNFLPRAFSDDDDDEGDDDGKGTRGRWERVDKLEAKVWVLGHKTKAYVVKADFKAGKSVIHKISKVLIPA